MLLDDEQIGRLRPFSHIKMKKKSFTIVSEDRKKGLGWTDKILTMLKVIVTTCIKVLKTNIKSEMMLFCYKMRCVFMCKREISYFIALINCSLVSQLTEKARNVTP